ncbi:MAG: SDR family oxidoreductase [Gammaproteobacteria bacterium]
MALLQGKVAMISGVGGGLGRDAALLFADEGAELVLLARSRTVIDPVAAEVVARGRSALALTADVGVAGDCARAVEAAIGRFGRIDVLINVVYRSAYVRLEDCTPDIAQWRASFDMNVWATMQMTRAVLPHMIARHAGRIVMVNTMMSDMPMAGAGAYAGSKSALQQITRTLALELAPHGIRVNGMHPGWMWGPQVQSVMQQRAIEAGTTPEQEADKVRAQIPLGYIPPTSEYAGTLLYLASELSNPVTGQSIHVNGGQWLH